MRAAAICLLMLVAGLPAAADELPVLISNALSVTIQDGEETSSWRLAPEVSPDVYEARLVHGRGHRVTFTSDAGSLSFDVEEGRSYDFIIQRGADRCLTRIVGTRYVPPAVFDARYQARHRGKIFVEVPEAYELVNVAIAMTPTGIGERGLVFQRSAYYQAMRRWFDPHRGHPLLATLDRLIKEERYFSLRDNAYALAFDRGGRLVARAPFDRVTAYEKENPWKAHLAALQSFADATRFRAFFARHRRTYRAQIAYYEREAGLAHMRAWLERHFPDARDHGVHKVIFSPLVGYNQSSVTVESKGFRELQAHVNFPYPEDFVDLSPAAARVMRGNIVFTELNHGYIGPERARHRARIDRAISNRATWVDAAKGPKYYRGAATFDEYMNWGLVSLRIVDEAPAAEQDVLIARIDRMMTQRRGFPQFQAFDSFLVTLYRRRRPGQTVAELYPEIIAWFEARNGR